MGATPTILNMIINTPVSGQRLVPIKVAAMTSRAPSPLHFHEYFSK